MLIYIVNLVTLVYLLYYYFTRTFNFWKDQNVKGPTPIPFFGNFKDVALRKIYMGELYRELYKEYPKEKVVGFYRMTSPTLLIRDLDLVKQVLVKDFESCPDRGTYFSKKKLGDNIFHSDFPTWKLLRNQLTPLFTTNKCKNRFHMLVERGDTLLNYMENVMKQPEQDMYRLFQKYTIGTAMSFLFDLDMDTFDDNNKMFDIIDESLIRLTYGNEMEMLFSGILKKFNMSLFSAKIVQFCNEVVAAGVNQEGDVKTDKSSLMELMRSLRKEGQITNPKHGKDGDEKASLTITDEVLAGQVFIFYIAGYGNNTLLLAYTMYYLAKHPEIQDKLIEEIDTVLERYDGQLTFEAIHEMKYLAMVFDETLRLHPLANSLPRCVNKDLKLDGLDLTIKKGTMIVVSPYAIQHDEQYYPEPDRFHPERFEHENVKNNHPCAYLSFGLGPRSCLGSKLGKLQHGVCLAKFLSKYRVEPSPNTIENLNKYDPYRLLLTPKERIYLNIVPRNS